MVIGRVSAISITSSAEKLPPTDDAGDACAPDLKKRGSHKFCAGRNGVTFVRQFLKLERERRCPVYIRHGGTGLDCPRSVAETPTPLVVLSRLNPSFIFVQENDICVSKPNG